MGKNRKRKKKYNFNFDNRKEIHHTVAQISFSSPVSLFGFYEELWVKSVTNNSI